MKPTLEWLEDPRIFQVHRLEAHSDHTFYQKTDGDCIQSLNGTWKVRVDKKPDDRPQGFEAADFDASSWSDIQVPGSIQQAGLAPHHYTNTIYPWDGHDHLRPPHISWKHNLTASYITDFELNRAQDDERVILEFNGVETAFYVWVNGKFAGYAEDSFTPSRFDISHLVHPGQNRLAVQVFQRSSASWIEDQDMFRLTGIFRDVNLVFWPRLHIQDLTVRTEEHALSVLIEARTAEGSSLQAVLLDPDGNEAACWSGPLESQTRFVLSVDHPKLWTAETPILYTLMLSLIEGGKTVETVRQPVGFRTVSIENGILKVNGRRIVFRGTNRHEFDPVHGRTLPYSIMEYDADMMKKLNINAVRTSHYPNQSAWYDLADSTGLWLIDETNMESHGSWQKLGVCEPSWNVPGNDPLWHDAVIDRVKSMYMRDKNHPSIILWSLGNESYGGTNILAMHDWLHAQDPTRPIHYEGVFWNREYDAASDVESRMYAKPHEIEEYLINNPKKPYLSCEFEHAMGNSLGNLDEYMALERYPAYQGGFIWDYVDQAIAARRQDQTVYLYGGDFGDVPNDFNFSGDGLLLPDRSLTPKAEELRRLYAWVKIEILPEGARITSQYAFRTLEGFTFAWSQKKDGAVLESGTFTLSLKPDESTIVPIAWKKQETPGLYTRTVTMEGYGACLAAGQSVEQIATPQDKTASAVITMGDGNFSFAAGGVTAFFQAGKGLISIKKEGREYLQGPVRPELFRASTDNDEGAGLSSEYGIWEAVQKHARVAGFEMEEGAAVTFTYTLPYTKGALHIQYRMDKTGRLHVRVFLPARPGRPKLPLFGLRLVMPETFQDISWIGQGPADTYPDRAHQLVDRYTSTRKQEFVAYLRPQEHGNHMETWQGSVQNSQGHGLLFLADPAPFQFSVSAWSSEELQNAQHPHELPQPYRTVVRIAGWQAGVGGDDSWGAPVHETYLLQDDQDLDLSFMLEAI